MSKITVSDIIKYLKINRGTFYLHYSDKDSLIINIEKKLNKELEKKLVGVMDEILVVNPDIKAPHPQLLRLFHFLNKNKKLLTFLVGQNGDSKFIQNIFNILKKNLLLRITQIKGKISFNSTIPADYVIQIVVSGLVDIIQFWLKKEDSSEKDITDIIVKTRVLSPYQLLGLKD